VTLDTGTPEKASVEQRALLYGQCPPA
jgi:hypothetical protein